MKPYDYNPSRRLICHVQQLLFAECRQLLDYMMKTQAYFFARCQVLFGLTIICNISLKDREAEGGRKSIEVRKFKFTWISQIVFGLFWGCLHRKGVIKSSTMGRTVVSSCLLSALLARRSRPPKSFSRPRQSPAKINSDFCFDACKRTKCPFIFQLF